MCELQLHLILHTPAKRTIPFTLPSHTPGAPVTYTHIPTYYYINEILLYLSGINSCSFYICMPGKISNFINGQSFLGKSQAVQMPEIMGMCTGKLNLAQSGIQFNDIMNGLPAHGCIPEFIKE